MRMNKNVWSSIFIALELMNLWYLVQMTLVFLLLNLIMIWYFYYEISDFVYFFLSILCIYSEPFIGRNSIF